MKQMADLYQQTAQWQQYAQALRKLSEMTEEPRERAEVCVRLGQLQEEQFHSPETAVKLFREALEAVPTQLDALKALERIHRNRSEWGDLIDVLKRKVQAVDDPEGSLAAKLELAEAYEDRVSDKTQAIEQYRRVLDEDSDQRAGAQGPGAPVRAARALAGPDGRARAPARDRQQRARADRAADARRGDVGRGIPQARQGRRAPRPGAEPRSRPTSTR